MDKPKIIGNVKIDGDICKLYSKLHKEKNINKIVSKIKKFDINNVILEKQLLNNKEFINYLNEYDINIFDGKWLVKYLSFELLDYVVQKMNIKKQETEIAITVNEITDIAIETIKEISKQYKKLIVVSNHIDKLKRIENKIFNNDGILIILSNNKKKALLKSKLILNMDFNYEVLNKYRINENACIINLEGNMKIDSKRFNGISINDYEIDLIKDNLIFDYDKYRLKDVYESNLYVRNTFKNIRKKIIDDKVYIKDIYGINGKIERFC